MTLSMTMNVKMEWTGMEQHGNVNGFDRYENYRNDDKSLCIQYWRKGFRYKKGIRNRIEEMKRTTRNANDWLRELVRQSFESVLKTRDSSVVVLENR